MNIKQRLQTEAMQTTEKNEVSVERYDEMLGILPPVRMLCNAFLVGEPTRHNDKGQAMYQLYFTHEGKYYDGGLAAVADFNLWLIPDERFRSKTLNCGCCGMYFKTWAEYIDQDQDRGFGICMECQGIAEDKEKEAMNEAIISIINGFKKPKNKEKFINYDRKTQEAIVFKMIENKTLMFSIGKR